MAERTALLYENRSSVESLDSLCQTLGRVGLQLAHPGSRRVVMLGSEGQQIEGTLKDLMGRLSAECDVSFQLWFEEGHDLYCRIRRQGSTGVVELGMEGCFEDELNVLGKALREYFVSSRDTSIGFVFDPQGVAEDYDWDRFFLLGESLDWASVGFALPTMLGFLNSEMARVRGLPESAVVVHKDGLVIVGPS
ncbi:hypothetical protein [Sorangium sp. So ce1151]|uniref:hypothetical protein n=1 Tax=Sorangium sp. So ce1151 TaxID=3133332 RepID=UPI003F5F4EA2